MSGNAPVEDQATVFVVEDDSGMRRSIRALIESIGLTVQTFTTGREFIEQYEGKPGCLVLDLRLPDISGLQVMRHLQERFNATPPTVMITGHGDVSTAVAAMKQGVLDFLEKPFSPQHLLDHVQTALQRDAETRKAHRQCERITENWAALSERERQVLELLLAGHPNKQVAVMLNLSVKTVSTHRSNILAKFGVDSLVELVRRIERTEALCDESGGIRSL